MPHKGVEIILSANRIAAFAGQFKVQFMKEIEITPEDLRGKVTVLIQQHLPKARKTENDMHSGILYANWKINTLNWKEMLIQAMASSGEMRNLHVLSNSFRKWYYLIILEKMVWWLVSTLSIFKIYGQNVAVTKISKFTICTTYINLLSSFVPSSSSEICSEMTWKKVRI